VNEFVYRIRCVRKEERRYYYLCGEQEQEMKIKTKYDFNIKNGVCMVCVNQINQSIVGHNNIYYEHDDDGMVWYGIWHRYDLYYSIIIIVCGKLN